MNAKHLLESSQIQERLTNFICIQESGSDFSRQAQPVLVNVNNELVPRDTILSDGDYLIPGSKLIQI